ncbi:MAG TPA: DUF3052 domain-containing protein [Tahibacter sp.]|nr:DUF3052 domain-containing protein [Tahibacter sp.]
MSTTRNDAAGYSGKPLWQKLGLKPGLRVRVVDAPSDYTALTGFDLGLAVVLARAGAFDFGHAFVHTRRELDAVLTKLDPLLDPAGQLWISWPKKASKVPTDITEDTVRELALPRGLVDVKVCAVDAVWSGLKLVRRKALR